MSWPTLADSNLNLQSRQLWLMSRPYCVEKRRNGGKRRFSGMMTQDWPSSLRPNVPVIIAFTSPEATQCKCFVCALTIHYSWPICQKEGGVKSRPVVCASTESRTSTTYYLIAQHWRTAEVPVGGARTEPRSSGLSFPCSWKRRS